MLEMIAVRESGLYFLVPESRKTEEKAYKRRITHDVVPAICKHGVSAIDEILNDPDSLIVAIAGLQQKGRKTKLTRKIAELEPKAGCDDFALSCCNVLPVTVTAKDYGWPGKKMNLFLADQGVQDGSDRAPVC